MEVFDDILSLFLGKKIHFNLAFRTGGGTRICNVEDEIFYFLFFIFG
jgi:hypothetical protein